MSMTSSAPSNDVLDPAMLDDELPVVDSTVAALAYDDRPDARDHADVADPADAAYADPADTEGTWIDLGTAIDAPHLQVDLSDVHGTGVFAARDFDDGELIERCPVLALSEEDAHLVGRTSLADYVYEWEDGAAVALGFGSLYNHSREPNARYEMDYELSEIHVLAITPIDEGDEILINYNGDPANPTPVWFEE